LLFVFIFFIFIFWDLYFCTTCPSLVTIQSSGIQEKQPKVKVHPYI
jgi:hypothetical protein